MVSEAIGRLFRRKDDKYLLYIPKDLAEDSMFPFPLTEHENSVKVRIYFEISRHELHVKEVSE